MDKFITQYASKTAIMSVTVTNNRGEIQKIYDVPAGFQLERYVGSLYPNATLTIDFPKNKNNPNVRDFRIKLVDTHSIETHLGVYYPIL
mgnify:CR=1 FL=1